MKLRFNSLFSDIIITIYILVSLFFRIKWELSNEVSTAQSMAVGLSFIVFLWALIKLKVLNPNWFGLFKSKTIKL